MSKFKVGDRVSGTDMAGSAVSGVNDGDNRYLSPQAACFRAELVTPAPCGTTAANDNKPAKRAFEVGDLVRDEDGDIGTVTGDDGGDDFAPYTVEFLAGYSGPYCASALTPWSPYEGDHVRILSDEWGEEEEIAIVDLVDEDGVSVALLSDPDETTLYQISDLEPVLPHEPDAQVQTYKPGDTVVVVDNSTFRRGINNGDVAIVVRTNGRLTTLYFDGVGEQITEDHIRPFNPATDGLAA